MKIANSETHSNEPNKFNVSAFKLMSENKQQIKIDNKAHKPNDK